MKFKQKFCANHKYNRGLLSSSSNSQTGDDNRRIFYTVTTIMIFMNAIVCINTAAVPSPREAGILATLQGESRATQSPTLRNNTGRNPIIAQQSSKTSAPQKPIAAMANSSSSRSHSSGITSFGITKTNRENQADSNSNSASSHQSSGPLSQNLDNCKSLTGTWGDVDPNIYYLCDTQTNQPLQMRCPEGRGYFNGLGHTGCIPYEDWPACKPLKAQEQVHICDREHMQQPWETMNPNKFYICLQEATEPVLLNCGQGKGFLHVLISGDSSREAGADGGGTADSEIVGCANWEKWRSYMQCTDYY